MATPARLGFLPPKKPLKINEKLPEINGKLPRALVLPGQARRNPNKGWDSSGICHVRGPVELQPPLPGQLCLGLGLGAWAALLFVLKLSSRGFFNHNPPSIISLPTSRVFVLLNASISVLPPLFSLPGTLLFGFQPSKEHHAGRDCSPGVSPSLHNSLDKNVVAEEFLLLSFLGD